MDIRLRSEQAVDQDLEKEIFVLGDITCFKVADDAAASPSTRAIPLRITRRFFPLALFLGIASPRHMLQEIELVETTEHVHHIRESLLGLGALRTSPDLAEVPQRRCKGRLRGAKPVEHGFEGVKDLASAVVGFVGEIEDDGEWKHPCCCEGEGVGGLCNFDGIVAENSAT